MTTARGISAEHGDLEDFLPLQGVRVLDFSKVLAGPLCTQQLAELGADVIKVEPERGDDTRVWPPLAKDGGTIFLAVNRSKRSIGLDLKSERGREIAHRLAESCDVVVESFGPGAADRLGIGVEELQARRPQLIYCSVSGYGTRGPMRDAKGYDLIAQAFTGMLALTGEPGGPPTRTPFSPVDQATGLHAVSAILAALFRRERTGRGARLEVSLFDSAVGFLGYFLQSYWQRGTEPVRPGSGHESLCPYQAFNTADKPLILGIANDALWRGFCQIAGVPELAHDERYATGVARVAHRQETIALVEQLLKHRSRNDWLRLFETNGIPCSPVHTLGELSSHPQTEQSGMVFSYQDSAGDSLKAVAVPLRANGARLPARTRPPLLGEHSAQILTDLGLSDQEIKTLVAQRVVFVNTPLAPANVQVSAK